LAPRTPSYRSTARAAVVTLIAVLGAIVVAGCGADLDDHVRPAAVQPAHPARAQLINMTVPRLAALPPLSVSYHVPSLLDVRNVYAADERLSPVVRHYRRLVYVPDSASDSLDEVDQRTYRVVRQFQVGAVPQHVVPSYDLRTLWVTNDVGNSLTPIDPATGNPGPPVQVDDPYNLYFTPDGRYAMVMAEQLRRIDFRDPHTMALRHSLQVPGCAGVNHADFTADGHFMLVSCEFAAKMIVVDVPAQRLVRTLGLPPNSSAQDVKLSPDGRVFYVADLNHAGVWEISADHFRTIGFIPTGAGAHGLYPSRNAAHLFVSNRSAGTVSVISFKTRRVVATWHIPGGSPDMGGVSIDGRVLWLAGRYNAVLYAINTRTGTLIKQIPVGLGPHGASVYPQPGRYSLGHTGVMR
jgi:DNA-binding beta-propeller fold protein YncE